MPNLERYYSNHIVRIRHRHKESGKTKKSLHNAFICLSHLSCVKPASCLHHHDGNARYQLSKNIYQRPSTLQILLLLMVGSSGSRKKANKQTKKSI